MVQETEKPGVSVAQVCRRHGIRHQPAFPLARRLRSDCQSAFKFWTPIARLRGSILWTPIPRVRGQYCRPNDIRDPLQQAFDRASRRSFAHRCDGESDLASIAQASFTAWISALLVVRSLSVRWRKRGAS